MKYATGTLSKALVLPILVWGASLMAQNVTINMEPAPVKYYRLPDRPLDPSFTTYETEINTYGGNLIKAGVTTASLENTYMSLQGYTRSSQDADVTIEATVSDFTVISERRESRQKKSKTKDGTELVTTMYSIEIKYALPVTITVKDRNGRILDDGFIFSLSDQRTSNTPERSSISELESYWRVNRTSKLAELHKSMLTEAFKKINDRINNEFGYRRVTSENARFATVGKKKHPDYGKFRTAYETIKRGFSQMDPDKALDPVRKAIEPAMTFYMKQEAQYDANDKEEARLKYMCLYNLALAYFWTENFDLAAKYGNLALKTDEKERDTKNLLDEIADVQASLDRAKKTSRHGIQVVRS